MIYISDPHAEFRRALSRLLADAGLPARAFDNAHSLLAACAHTLPRCVLTEFRLPDLGVVELMERLHQGGAALPVIVVTSHSDAASAVWALRSGATDYFVRPFNEQFLLDRVQLALREETCRRHRQAARAKLQQRLDSLSARERQVLEGLLQGQGNKQIAQAAGLSQKTVENCRARLSTKMQAGSLAELVRVALAAGAGTATDQGFFHAPDGQLDPHCACLCPHRLMHQSRRTDHRSVA